MKKTALSIIAVMWCLCLVACGNSEKGMTDDEIRKAIVGAWTTEYEGSRMGFIFNEDGTGFATLFPMTYTIEEGVITITIEAFGQTETGSAKLDLEGDALVLEQDGEIITLQRTEMPE